MTHLDGLVFQTAAVLAAVALIARLLVQPLVRWGKALAAKVELIEEGVHKVSDVDRNLSELVSIREAIEQGVKAMQKIQGSQEDRVTLLEEENAHRVKWERTHDVRHEALNVTIAALARPSKSRTRSTDPDSE